MKFDERNQNIYKIPPFLFAWQLQKFEKDIKFQNGCS
jgi:hypothetical protein